MFLVHAICSQPHSHAATTVVTPEDRDNRRRKHSYWPGLGAGDQLGFFCLVFLYFLNMYLHSKHIISSDFIWDCSR